MKSECTGELNVKLEDHVQIVEDLQPDANAVVEERAAKLDVSMGSGKELQFGKETLMVNASIMTITYKPWNGAWLVDMDLPMAD